MKKLMFMFIFTFIITLAFPLLASENLPVYEAEILDEKLEKGYFLGCSLACAIGWSFKDSSHLKEQGENIYTTEVLWDGEFDTAWCEGSEGDGVGEWIEFHLDEYGNREIKDVNFNGITIANGYLKSEEIWKKNSRVKEFRMDINGAPVCYIRLKDNMYIQDVLFTSPYFVSEGDVIRLTITDVYPGEIYSDTCISEIVLKGAH